MKKLLLICLLLNIFPGFGQSIQPLPIADSTILDELRLSLSTLNTGRMSTNVLLNRVIPISNPQIFNGDYTNAAVNSYENWEQQYWEYYNGANDKSALEDISAIHGRISAKMNSGQIPLVLLEYKYDELLPDAATLGLIRIDSVNERVYDGPRNDISPYSTKVLFSAALTKEELAGTMTVYVGNDFWLGNTTPPSYVYVDFGDGLGWRFIWMNSTIQVNFGAIQAAGTTIQQRVIHVWHPQTNSPEAYARTAAKQQRIIAVAPDAALGIKASTVWPGNGKATAIAWIKYAPDNKSGKFRKPLIFVEGIDFSPYMGGRMTHRYCNNTYIDQTGYLNLAAFQNNSCVNDNYRNGEAGWNEIAETNDDYPALERMPELRTRLQNQEGYDIVYLDFSDGATHIQSNALTLVELINGCC